MLKRIAHFLSPLLVLITTSAFAIDDYNIKPYQIVTDMNSVDLLTGRYYPRLPVLGIPAAPNLTFESMQQFDSKITGTLWKSNTIVYTGTGQGYLSNNYSDTSYPLTFGSGQGYLSINYSDRKETYSLTFGGKTSEYFTCVMYECEANNNTGSKLFGNMNASSHTFTYFQRKTGMMVRYDQSSSLFNYSGDGYNPKNTEGTWYASKVTFADGEEHSLSYTKATSGNVTYHRPKKVVSSLGYEMLFTYHSTSIGNSGWGKVATATIVKSSAPNVALAKHTYQLTSPAKLTDLTGRVWQYGGFTNGLGSPEYSTNFTMKLPGDSANSIAVSTTGKFVTKVVRDGQTYNYAYTAKSGSGYDATEQFYKLIITGPQSYKRTLDYSVKPAPNHYQLITKSTNGLSQATQFSYTSYNKLDTVTYPEGNKVSYEYDVLGNVIEKRESAKSGSGLADIVVSAYYDISGCYLGEPGNLGCYRPRYTRDAEGNQTDYTFDPDHGGMLTLLAPADENGERRLTTHTFDQINGHERLLKTSVCGLNSCGTQDELVTDYDYYLGDGQVKTVKHTNGINSLSQTTTYTYDDNSAGRVIVEDGPLSGTDDAVYSQYDTAGRKTWSIGAKNQQNRRVAQRYTYRHQDNQIEKIETGTLTSGTATSLQVFATSTTTYDSKGLATKTVDTSPTTTETVQQFTYDSRNRQICLATRMNPAKFSALPTSACSVGTSGDYGVDRIVRHYYDTLSRVTKTVSGYGTDDAGIDVEIDYTNNGQVEWRKDGNGNQTDYDYDGVDRLYRTTFADGSYEQNTYDKNSNLKTWRKRDGKYFTHYYDDTNLKYRTNITGESTLYYDYDGFGRQVKARRGSDYVSFGYDGLGRLASSNTNGRTLGYQYDGASRRSRLTHPDGFYVTYAYDATGALTSLKEKGSTTSLVGYTYNTQGQLTSMSRANGKSSTLGYDKKGRMNAYNHTGMNDSAFDYNPANQLISRAVSNADFQIKIPSISQESYQVNNLNQYDSVGTKNISYDNAGNLTNYDSWSYVYNAHNRLTSATKTGSSLAYDPTGRLESSTLNGSKTNFLYDGDELVAEYNSSGTVTRRYVHGLGEDDPQVMYICSGTTNAKYLLADERGSIIAETNSSGSVTATHQYGPYGEPENTSTSRFRYTGQILLPGTELYYYKARFYHPQLGRFLQTDPVGYEDQMNMYAYVGNDPVNNTDPTGMFLNFIAGGIGGFIAEVGTQILTEGKVTSWNKVALSTGVGALTSGYSIAAQGLKAGTIALAANSTMDGIAAFGGNLVADGLDGNIEGSLERSVQAAFDSAIGPGKQAMMGVKGIVKEAGIIKNVVRNTIVDKVEGALIDGGTQGLTGAAASIINKVDDE